MINYEDYMYEVYKDGDTKPTANIWGETDALVFCAQLNSRDNGEHYTAKRTDVCKVNYPGDLHSASKIDTLNERYKVKYEKRSTGKYHQQLIGDIERYMYIGEAKPAILKDNEDIVIVEVIANSREEASEIADILMRQNNYALE